MQLFNKKSTKEKRVVLRKSQTEAEKVMWAQLRGKRLMGYKFFRQFGIGEYIADFYCSALKLVIELDGSQHLTDENWEYDKIRAEFMKALGIKTMRFSNGQVINELESVMNEIRKFIVKK